MCVKEMFLQTMDVFCVVFIEWYIARKWGLFCLSKVVTTAVVTTVFVFYELNSTHSAIKTASLISAMTLIIKNLLYKTSDNLSLLHSLRQTYSELM